MTIREHLISKKRRSSLAVYLGMLAFFGAAIVGRGDRALLICGLIGFAVSFLGMVYMIMLIRCPACHNRLGNLLASTGGPFSVSASLRCCPFCAVEFDSELPEAIRGS